MLKNSFKDNAHATNVGCIFCLGPSSLYSSVKTLDLSHNNISFISPHFFVPVELSLINLHLSHNELLKATSDIFGSLVYLQHLDISHNRLFKIEENTFHNSRNLQVEQTVVLLLFGHYLITCNAKLNIKGYYC